MLPTGHGVFRCSTARLTPFSLKAWSKHLLLRRDRLGSERPWAEDIHSLATLFSVLHRKDLLQAVRAKISAPGFARQAHDFGRVTTTDFDLLAHVLGETGTVRNALRALASSRYTA